MAQTKMEWTSAVWNPLVGCSRVSEGCRHCYAERTAFRLAAMGQKQYEAVTSTVLTKGGAAWNGKVEIVESALDLPLRWRRPRRIFVNSMSDLFHERVPDEWIDPEGEKPPLSGRREADRPASRGREESDRHLHGPVTRHGCSARICVLLNGLDRDYPGWKELA